MTVVVLGWDGLDYDLIQRYGLEDAFGDHVREIGTIVNPSLGKPHTWEVWPSIITGQRPQEHGVRAEDYIEGGWENPVLNWAARLSKPLPDRVRWAVGKHVRNAGATVDFESSAYYDSHGIETVFDDCRAFPLAIPNYRSEFDDQYGIESDRGAVLLEFLEETTAEDGESYRSPTVSPEVFAGRIASSVGRKVALTQHAIRNGNELVFVWFAYLDTAGHVAPTMGAPDRWMKRHYEQAADWTRTVERSLDDDDVLFCVSDHGLQLGRHTERAVAAARPASAVRDVGGVCDIADAIAAATRRTDGNSHRGVERTGGDGAVKDRLEALGYV